MKERKKNNRLVGRVEMWVTACCHEIQSRGFFAFSTLHLSLNLVVADGTVMVYMNNDVYSSWDDEGGKKPHGTQLCRVSCKETQVDADEYCFPTCVSPPLTLQIDR